MVAFWSRATNLYPGVSDGYRHLFIAKVSTGKVIRVVDVSAGNVLSNDGSSDSAERRADVGAG